MHKFSGFLLLLLFSSSQYSCKTNQALQSTSGKNKQEIFWNDLNALCGKAYSGVVVNPLPGDSAFTNRPLIMHVRSCKENELKIPFVVGDDLSRTWVVTRSANSIQLKHDHRHKDGSEDAVTQYGGTTSNSGSATFQMFPADQHTANILPAAAGNVWWMEVVPGKYFTYNLRRIGTERLFTIRFDITNAIVAPAAPWGWKN